MMDLVKDYTFQAIFGLRPSLGHDRDRVASLQHIPGKEAATQYLCGILGFQLMPAQFNIIAGPSHKPFLFPR